MNNWRAESVPLPVLRGRVGWGFLRQYEAPTSAFSPEYREKKKVAIL